MEIIRAENAGFCFGVKRAINLAFEAAAKSKKNVYSLGPLIHNPQTVDLLTRKGVYVVTDLEIPRPGDTLIIRSHGTTPEILDEAKKRDLNIVDATCPFVIKAQKVAQQLSLEGYQVVIVGEGDHPEVIGLKGFAGKDSWVLENAEDAKLLPNKPRIGIIAQTTQSFENYRGVISLLLEKSYELKAFNTICNATNERQEAAINLAKRANIMIVIGGHNSANTNRLAFLCSQSGVPTHHIETIVELSPSWFDGMEVVGITAGASTPDWVIEEVISRLSSLGLERKNS